MEKKQIPTTEAWQAVAKKLLATLPHDSQKATVVGLSGDLGVGKTTLVQNIAKELGVSEPITSPTFTILKTYQTNHTKFDGLIHMDAYRLESLDELTPLRFQELLSQPNSLVCIEWAEKIKAALPPTTHYFKLEIDVNQKHTIQTID